MNNLLQTEIRRSIDLLIGSENYCVQTALEYFPANREKVYNAHYNEQAYLSWAIAQKEPLLYWDPTWRLSFKRSFMRRFPLGYFCEPKKIDGVKIIIFRRNPNPDCVRDGWHNKSGLRAVKKTPWLADLWMEIPLE